MNGYTTTTMRPGRSPWEATTGMYRTALQRFLSRLGEARGVFGRAEAPLEEARALYAPGGAYGRGQMAIAEEEMRRGRAEAMHGLVASGMASGSTAAGVRMAARRGLAKARMGIEDIRTERLSDVLSRLSALRAGIGQFIGGVQEPSYAPAASVLGGIYATDVGARRLSTIPQRITQGGTTEGLARARQHIGTQRLSVVPGQGRKTIDYTPPKITMGPGYGPAFQSPEQLARIRRGILS